MWIPALQNIVVCAVPDVNVIFENLKMLGLNLLDGIPKARFGSENLINKQLLANRKIHFVEIRLVIMK